MLVNLTCCSELSGHQQHSLTLMTTIQRINTQTPVIEVSSISKNIFFDHKSHTQKVRKLFLTRSKNLTTKTKISNLYYSKLTLYT